MDFHGSRGAAFVCVRSCLFVLSRDRCCAFGVALGVSPAASLGAVRTDGAVSSELPSEDFLSRYAGASVSHGYLLAVLERLRRSSEDAGNDTAAWSMAVIQHMLDALPFGSVEHMALHNVVASFVEEGLSFREPSLAAVTAFEVHAGDL